MQSWMHGNYNYLAYNLERMRTRIWYVYTIYGISILIFIYWYPIYVSYIVTGNRFLNTDRFKYHILPTSIHFLYEPILIPFPNAPLIPNLGAMPMPNASSDIIVLPTATHFHTLLEEIWAKGVANRDGGGAGTKWSGIGGCDKRELNNFTLLAIIGSDWRCRLPSGYDLVYANELAAYNWPKGAETRCQDEGAADVATRFRFDSFGLWPDSWLVGLLAALAARCVSGVE